MSAINAKKIKKMGCVVPVLPKSQSNAFAVPFKNCAMCERAPYRFNGLNVLSQA
jgi:hypothetical protein